jgi:hypothetical protein
MQLPCGPRSALLRVVTGKRRMGVRRAKMRTPMPVKGNAHVGR